MTIEDIQARLKKAGKPVSRMSVYRYLDRLNISPCKPAQRPQRYPDTAADTLIRYFGLGPQFPPLDTAAGRIASMGELRNVKRKARAGR